MSLYQHDHVINSFNNYHDYKRQFSKGLFHKLSVKRKIPTTPIQRVPNLQYDIPVELHGRCYISSITHRVCNICDKKNIAVLMNVETGGHLDSSKHAMIYAISQWKTK